MRFSFDSVFPVSSPDGATALWQPMVKTGTDGEARLVFHSAAREGLSVYAEAIVSPCSGGYIFFYQHTTRHTHSEWMLFQTACKASLLCGQIQGCAPLRQCSRQRRRNYGCLQISSRLVRLSAACVHARFAGGPGPFELERHGTQSVAYRRFV